ncbi:MAG: ABC transporter substrate-binding protein, partial [Deltaproteobacteria bacterium]|nr:ABC transporter substrate-binding protein [Deltaproteobacteria bacterium]
YVLIDQILDYSKTGAAGFEVRFKEMGGEIVGKDNFQNQDVSIATQITKLKKVIDKVDCIYLSSIPPGGGSAIRQIRAAGIDLPIISPGAMGGDLWMKATPNLSNFYVVNYGSIYGDDPRPLFNDMVKYVATKCPVVDSELVTAYSVGEAFFLAIERAKGKTDGDSLKKALEAFKDEPFLTGAITFTPEMHASQGRDVYITQSVDGKVSYLEKVELGAIPNLKDFLK